MIGVSVAVSCQQSSLFLTPSCSRAASPSPSRCPVPSTATSPSSLPAHVRGSIWWSWGSRASRLWPRPSTPALTAGCTRAPQGGIWTTSVEACLVKLHRLKFKEMRGEWGATQRWGRESEEEEQVLQMDWFPSSNLWDTHSFSSLYSSLLFNACDTQTLYLLSWTMMCVFFFFWEKYWGSWFSFVSSSRHSRGIALVNN